MMHSNMKQIAIQSGHAQRIFARSVEIFHDWLGPGEGEDVTALTL